MGWTIGIAIGVPEETTFDLQELREEATEWLIGRFGGSNGMYCVPSVYWDEEDETIMASVQVICWGQNLENAGYEINDIYRVLAVWAFNRFDPRAGLTVETW